jgi:uncharacterized protein
MANYAVDPKILEPYLPAGVELDFYDGKTYLSLVGFMFRGTRIFQVPIPGLGTFEEVNLRFYVKRRDGNQLKRGVVFINETVPYKLVAWIANILYKEHYSAVPTRHSREVKKASNEIGYFWKSGNRWNSISVVADSKSKPMPHDSFEEYIFEHYYGYTRINISISDEYKVEHPRWNISDVLNYEINCDFEEVYGKSFGFLNTCEPNNVIFALGSNVAVKWKRTKLQL